MADLKIFIRTDNHWGDKDGNGDHEVDYLILAESLDDAVKFSLEHQDKPIDEWNIKREREKITQRTAVVQAGLVMKINHLSLADDY